MNADACCAALDLTVRIGEIAEVVEATGCAAART
ncbi:hypothetical protein HNR21_003954 [Actinomadura cellulosilytica]|uniref:Uncharacterized protein n=1 Tax=Thermomonospora cellulosilytica TaxID=1411118 RepID=A0A7W3R9S7_9ACTN|nr:hypothetical protein [Thermomonospora cellulosilytica]